MKKDFWRNEKAKREPSREDFLIDSGGATSVSQQSLADSLGGKPSGVQLRSAIKHCLTLGQQPFRQ